MLGNTALSNLFDALELLTISPFLWLRSGFGCIHLRGDRLSLGSELEGPLLQQSAQTIPSEASPQRHCGRLGQGTWPYHSLF